MHLDLNMHLTFTQHNLNKTSWNTFLSLPLWEDTSYISIYKIYIHHNYIDKSKKLTRSDNSREDPTLAKLDWSFRLHEFLQYGNTSRPRPGYGTVLGEIIRPTAGQHSIVIGTVCLKQANTNVINFTFLQNKQYVLFPFPYYV